SGDAEGDAAPRVPAAPRGPPPRTGCRRPDGGRPPSAGRRPPTGPPGVRQFAAGGGGSPAGESHGAGSPGRPVPRGAGRVVLRSGATRDVGTAGGDRRAGRRRGRTAPDHQDARTPGPP